MSKIPIRREEITSHWLQQRLSSVGKCEISGLDFEEMTGHNPDLSQLFRVRIEYRTRLPDHPDVVIVKIPPVDDVVRVREAAFGPYVGELGCYRLLGSFQGGSMAKMYSAVEDIAEKTACFVFEDLGTFPAGQKYARVDLDVARSAVEFMASYQARFWRDESLGESRWIRNANWAFLFNQDPSGAAIGWRVIQDDDRFEKTGGLVVAGEYLRTGLDDLRIALGTRPNTLTHNDFHQGNVLLRSTAEGPKPVIIDWQMPAYAGGTNDLAKFMMTAVPYEILESRENQLVEHYFEVLTEQGVSDYSLDECWRDFRRAQVAVFANYAITCYENSPDGPLIESSGDSTHAVIRALTLVDPAEFGEALP